MAEEFEWVSKKAAEEQSKQQALPATVKKSVQQSPGQIIVHVIRRVFVISGTLLLALFARLLLLIARIKIPHVTIPDRVNTYFRTTISRLVSTRFSRPTWLKVPEFVYKWKIPRHVLQATLSGLFFLCVLVGAGALFTISNKEATLQNYIFATAGLAAALWLFWKRSAAAIIARWLLQILRRKNSRGNLG